MSDAPVISLPVLPLRDIVVFPHMIVPLFVGREKSIKALEAVMAQDKQIYWLHRKKPRLRTQMLGSFWHWHSWDNIAVVKTA